MKYSWMHTPVGRLLVAGDDEGLRYVLFGDGREQVEPRAGWMEDGAALSDALGQLAAYFSGTLRRFDVKLAPQGTAFQRRVWQELQTIPYGETRSYGELARLLGKPGASRAVGLANGANPISIVIPCHRVIGSNGTLTGYGGGLKNKEWLLALERGEQHLWRGHERSE